MENTDEYNRARDEVYRCVGRNVLLFQHVELLLKTVLNRGQFQGTLSELAQLVDERRRNPDKRTFGQLIDPLLDRHLTPSKTEDPPPGSGDEICLSYGVTFAHTADERAAFERELKALVAERNHLIHHALAHFLLNSIAGCEAAAAELEQQHARILPVRAKMSALVKAMVEINADMLRRLPEIVQTSKDKRPEAS